MVTRTWVLGSVTTLLSTELNSIANAATVISSVGGTSGLFNNTYAGGGLGGYTLGRFELYIAGSGTALTANTGVSIWLLTSVDGTNYEDGSASVVPGRSNNLQIGSVRNVTTAQRIIQDQIILTAGNWYVLLQNNTGQTWNSSGNTLKLQPYTDQAG